MFNLFKGTDPPRQHLIVDSNGKYWGVYPSLISAREAVESIMAQENAPDAIYIWRAKLMDKVEKEYELVIKSFQHSEE